MNYNGVLTLDSVSFSVERGETIALLGANGAGKTTLVKAITGLIKPSAGSVKVFGLDPRKDRHVLGNRWSVMPQAGGLPTGYTTLEALKLFASISGSSEKPAEILELVGLQAFANQRWHRLSGGEQQRLSLGIALCGGNDLLILDEPTSGLDIDARIQLLETIKERSAKGTTTILTTHIYADAKDLADKVLLLDKGQLLANSTVKQLTQSQPEITFVAKPGLPIANIGKLLKREAVEASPGFYIIDGSGNAEVLSTLTQWLAENEAEVSNLKMTPRSLKESIYRLTEMNRQNRAEAINE